MKVYVCLLYTSNIINSRGEDKRILLVALLITVLFIILGVIFSLGKGAFLIAGYNTSNKEEKAKYDEKALCKFMGKSMFTLAFSVFLWGLKWPG